MKTVTQAFKDALRGEKSATKTVSFKRRYWDQATRKFVFESSWTDLRPEDVVRVDAVVQQLDSNQLNEFKISNVNIVLKNGTGEWLIKNPAGRFGPDTAQPAGYEPFWTKFRIQVTATIYGGTTETINYFVGLATDILPDPDGRTATARVEGLEQLLVKANAENVSTTVTGETLTGTVNGSNKDFTTANNGVGIIGNDTHPVSLSGATYRPGVDFTISQLNEPSLPAKVSFTVAPVGGTVPRATYKYWKPNKKVEELVADLCTEGAVTSTSIAAVLFPNTINNTWTQTSQADWTAGTQDKTDLTTAPGEIRIDFANTAFKTLVDAFDGSLDAGWTSIGTTVSITGNKLRLVATGSYGTCGVVRASSKVIGSWQFNVTRVSGTATIFMPFMAGDLNDSGSSVNLINAYYVALNGSGSIWLFRTNGSGTATEIASTTGGITDTSDHAIRVARFPSGRIDVYLDGALKISATDTTHTTSNKEGLVGGTSTWDFNDFYEPSATITAALVTQALDALAAPVSWGRLLTTETANGGTITYQTRVSTDNISYDADVNRNADFTIGSALKRYLKWEVTLSCASTANNNPLVSEGQVEYKSTATLISLANFTGDTCWQAIKELAAFSNYEFGFTADETFFFRAKSAGATDSETFYAGFNVTKLQLVSNGYDRVYTKVEATFGAYTRVVEADGLSKDDPKSRYAHRTLQIDGGDLLVPNDADIASGVAGLYARDYFRPRRRFKAWCIFMPHVDLGDVIPLTYNDRVPRKLWGHGDENVTLGDWDRQHWGGNEQIVADGTRFKVIGLRHDIDAKQSEFDLEEVAA